MDQAAAREDASVSTPARISLAGILAIAAITILGFLVFPGHTYLQSDTQIYVPMFDRLLDPTLFEHDPLVARHHVSLTVYDEVSIALHRVIGLDFEYVLYAQQIVFRFLGLLGIFWFAAACRLPQLASLLVTALVGLGCFVHGPAVVTFEYEPVPRGFAILLVFLAIGLGAQGRLNASAIALGFAFLYHAPTTVPFAIVLGGLALWQRKWSALLWMGGATALIAILAVAQPGAREVQHFFSTLDPDLEKLQRFRASYNWISQWDGWKRYDPVVLFVIVSAALLRSWRRVPVEGRVICAGLAAIGLLSLGVSYITMEKWRWALMAQVQPARAISFLSPLLVVFCCVCAWLGRQSKNPLNRLRDRLLWLAPVAVLVVHQNFTLFPIPGPSLYTMAILLVVVAIAFTFAASPSFRNPLAAAVLPAALFAFCGYSILHFAGRTNYAKIHSPELDDVASWAKSNTSKDDVFLFPTLSRRLEPGIFRVRAQRALYIDWKAGGQVNYSQLLAREWKKRWDEVSAQRETPAGWAAKGVRYLILPKATPIPGLAVAYENPAYIVYSLDALTK